MRLARLVLAGIVVAVFAGLAYVAQQTRVPGAAMVAAAQNFLNTLSAEQKAQATFAFDDKERTNWNFVPLQDNATKKATRKGLPLEAMSPVQRQAALALLKAGTSEAGHQAAVTIMSLESILRETEKGGAMIRNPDWYFVT
ncbi:MAG: DUF3500 domain-containing protein, partial [Gemmataceae bacterium]|nr:DUF3500 domain-containing protein [Gemmataceae bacterium]